MNTYRGRTGPFLLFFTMGTLGVGAGCGDDSPSGGAGGSGGGETGGGGAEVGGNDVGPLTKPDAGITDCAAELVDDDGVCRPSLAKCPSSSVPDVDSGCVPVGPTCHASLQDDRGLCLAQGVACAEGHYPVPSLGCVPLDGATGCGTGTWGEVVEKAGDVHVDASYAGADSNGSRAKPFIALADALAASQPGGRVVLAAGTYQAGVTLSNALELRGVCASQVTLTAAAPSERVVTIAPGASDSVTLSDLTIAAPVGGVRVQSGAAAMARLHVRDVSYKAIEVTGAGTTATLDDSLIEDTTPGGSASLGIGIQSAAGASLVVHRTALLSTQTTALQAFGGDILADDVLIRDTAADPNGAGYSAAAQNGGTLTVRNAVMGDNYQGIYVASDTTIDTSALGATVEGASDRVAVVDGALTVTASVVADGDTWGITSYDGQSGDVLIEHTLLTGIDTGLYGGSGISLAEGGTVRRSAFAGNVGPSLTVVKDATIDGVVVEDGHFDASLGLGSSITVADGGDVTIDRSYVRGVEDVGILTAPYLGLPGTLTIRHTRIEDLPGVMGAVGLGIGLGSPDISAVIEDTVIEDVTSAGIASVDAPLIVRRSRISNVAPGALNRFVDGEAAVGPIADGVLFLGESALPPLTLEDSWIENAQRAGVLASMGAHTMDRVRVTGGGVGVALRDGATVTRTDCDLSGSSAEVEDPTSLLIPP